MKIIRLSITVAALLAAALMFTSAKKVTWSIAGNHIRTEWAEKVSCTSPLPEYPRPQLVRQDWVNLNGLWDYAIQLKDEALPRTFDGSILVPYPVESALSGVGRSVSPEDALWYSRTFQVPSKWRKRRVMLNFGAVDYKAEVYVNGKLAGEHAGGYSAFSFDITDLLVSGSNQKLVLKVTDATDQAFRPRGKQVLDPQGIWYNAVTGIWQTVWLEPVDETHIASYLVTPDIDRQEAEISVNVDGAKEGDIVKVCISSAEGSSVECDLVPGASKTVQIPSMHLWTTDDPFTYSVSMKVVRGENAVLDSAEGYVAMRKISVVTDDRGVKRFALNNKPVFMFGMLDQGWWPDGLYTAPTDEALKFDIVKQKDFGYNLIRKHIKVEPARWYYWCDKLGIMVWQDMPSFHDNRDSQWGTHYYGEGTEMKVSDEIKLNYYREWEEIISQLKNFNSIVSWIPFNENWGQFDTKEVVDFTKRQDPTRLVNMSSGGNWFEGCGDILDTHHYPEPKINFWDFEMVNVLGEYGGIGYPVKGHLWNPDNNWGYVKYGNADAVLQTYQEYAEKLAKLVRIGCSGAIYTQTTDVEKEVNGIMTYDRKVIKVDEAKLREINLGICSLLNNL